MIDQQLILCFHVFTYLTGRYFLGFLVSVVGWIVQAANVLNRSRTLSTKTCLIKTGFLNEFDCFEISIKVDCCLPTSYVILRVDCSNMGGNLGCTSAVSQRRKPAFG